ncbi:MULTISPECIES: asparaginase domain-containing protein [Vitreoscilla]|uniref:Asparaginase domain-containing protein n=1 Tax=Vitreoscilla stercoraria TaxID=61 RepID=A0ABY4E7T8_VITST|nr:MULTISPECIES: asparaginase domain-containing protein [Vitreoscilla]UOO91810.1 asparaginase domain-containing protein [Vitreoscilla stercoraria]
MKIAVLYTGGTIGMYAGENGLRPSQETVLQALKVYQTQADFDVTVCHPLIDSSQVTQVHWCEWQQWLQQQTHTDAILILHGTDTMAYTANVLALAMGSLRVPVVLTGSQYPLGTENGDAETNLEAAVQALLQKAAPKQVSVVFANQMLAAIGSRKISTQSLDGFANKHHPPLNEFQNALWLKSLCETNVALMPKTAMTPLNPNIRIASHYCVPASEQWALRAILHSGADAVILQSFGHGNGWFSQADVQVMQAYQAQGGMIINVSQVFDGHVAAQYEASKALLDAKVFMAGAWTVETAYAKVWVGLSQGLRGHALQHYLQQDVLGDAGCGS